MRKIIISSDIDRLKALFKWQKEKYFYIVVEPSAGEIEYFLKENDCEKIDIYEGLEGIDFSREYIDFIGSLNIHYNSIYWLATSISYKGVFVSDLRREIYNYYCVISLIKKRDCNCLIISAKTVFDTCIKNYCRQNNIECQLLGEAKRPGFITCAKRALLNNLYFVYDGWRRKALAYLFLSKRIKRSVKKGKPYYVIKSWIEKRSFRQEGGYSDVFFGRLPEFLKGREKEFIILAGILNNYRELLGKVKSAERDLIIPQEYFVGYLDYLKAIALTFINRPKITRPIMFCGLDVADFLIDCLNRDYESNEVNKNFIYYYYIKGFLRNIKAGTFIFTFENQAWEKISVAAVRRYSRSTKIIGYAHTSIRPSMLGYFCSKEEEAALSLPDKIITIGREPKLILQMSGNYKDERRIKVSEGCALRYEYLFNKNRIGWNRAGKILAVLSIDTYYSMRLLRFLCDSLGANDKYSVILRSHPFTPAEIIMEKFNIMPKNNFIISKNLRLEEDMEGAALIIYVDTTSSIEALLCGIPAVCVDLKEPINPDPLFKLNKLKWTIFDKPSLINTVDHIYNMDEVEYEKNYKDAVMYLKDYFYPVEEKYLEEFII